MDVELEVRLLNSAEVIDDYNLQAKVLKPSIDNMSIDVNQDLKILIGRMCLVGVTH